MVIIMEHGQDFRALQIPEAAEEELLIILILLLTVELVVVA
jgi:hypothetical protein